MVRRWTTRALCDLGYTGNSQSLKGFHSYLTGRTQVIARNVAIMVEISAPLQQTLF
jgi:hypothetical protein